MTTPEVMPTPPMRVDENATRLVRQAVADLIAAQAPSIQAACAATFNSFMDRCVVLAQPEPPSGLTQDTVP